MKPKSEIGPAGLDQIPLEGLRALGRVFAEGEQKYGRDNWKNDPGNEEYNRERLRHAIDHLFRWAHGDREEEHLAKVAWFCFTQLARENDISEKRVVESPETRHWVKWAEQQVGGH